MAAAAVTADRAAAVTAVHLTDSTMWVHRGDRSAHRPAGVLVADGGLEVGVDRSMAVGDDAFESSPALFVDDDVLLLGETAVPMPEVLAAVLAHGIAAVGAAVPVGLLVLTCPSGWGIRRRRVLTAAGRAVAREVRVIAVADAVRRLVGAEEPGIVVEVGELGSAATVGSAHLVIDTIGSRDLVETDDAAPELVTMLHAAWPEVPAWVAVTGEPPAARLAVELHRGWDGLPRAVEVRGAAVAAAAHAWGVELAGPPRPDREPSPTRRSRARPYGVGILLVGVLAAGAAWILPGAAPDPVPAEPPRMASGRASITVPDGWEQRATGRADRIDLRPADGHPARMLLAQKELNPGADLDAVARTLAGRIAERPGTFGELGRVNLDSRDALAYREFPEPDSQVRWHVFVIDGLQVSLGCQASPDLLVDLEPACDRVGRSVTVAPR
ncbi:type VII secretion-associated protein [Rhodococcus sp. NPDC058505]|uniref:type VII secretion-associated protein n=1 Tax=Rhodococcus sp. NPDC058505 TaxID=3346531 RepID=UPI0036503D77